MLLTIVLTFLMTSALYGLAAWFACWRISHHLRDNSYATGVVVEHVILPLLGRRSEAREPALPGDAPESPVPASNGATSWRSDGVDRLA